VTKNQLDGALLDRTWDFGDAAGTEARLRALRNDAGSDSMVGAELTTQIARALGLQGRFAEAHAELDSIPVEEPIVVSRVELERGRLLNSSGDPVAAVPHFTRAVHSSKLVGDDFLQVDALHMLAIVAPDAADQWTRQALDIVEESRDPRVQRWAGALYNNLGWNRHDAGLYVEALQAFEAALDCYTALGTPEQIHVARWSIARCLRSLGRFTEALAIQAQLQRHDPPDPYVLEEITILRSALGERDQA
jgi:tetratricopeptide (TPR) repeat protein